MTPEIELAIKLLKEAGYKIKPPSEIAPLPNGCFRIDCGTDVFFVEGREEEKDKIRLDFEEKGHTVKEIKFAEDMFYLLEPPISG